MKKTPPLRPKFADTEEGPGTGRLLLPKGAPCELCGKPVKSLKGNVGIVLESEEGNPFWSIQHARCIQRAEEVEARRRKTP